jgi:hypothetical protein
MDIDFVLNSEDMIQMFINLVPQFVDLDAVTTMLLRIPFVWDKTPRH